MLAAEIIVHRAFCIFPAASDLDIIISHSHVTVNSVLEKILYKFTP